MNEEILDPVGSVMATIRGDLMLKEIVRRAHPVLT